VKGKIEEWYDKHYCHGFDAPSYDRVKKLLNLFAKHKADRLLGIGCGKEVLEAEDCKMVKGKIFDLMKRSIKIRFAGERLFSLLISLPLIRDIYDFAYFRMLIKPKSQRIPRCIVVETYNVCNLRCIMCPYPVMTRPKTQMAFTLFQKVVENSLEVGITTMYLHNYGEPLLDSLLFDRIEFAKSKGMFVGFTSNATLLTSEKQRQIVESGLDEICFSVDGVTKEVYERIRVGAQFEKVIASINELIAYKKRKGSKNPFIRISCVVQKDNYQQLAKQSKELYRIFRTADSVKFEVADSRRNESTLPVKKRGSASRVYPCAEIWRCLIVLSSGNVVPCCRDYDGVLTLGSLNEQSIEEIWNSENFTKIRQLHLNREGDKIELCKDCPFIYKYGAIEWLYI